MNRQALKALLVRSNNAQVKRLMHFGIRYDVRCLAYAEWLKRRNDR